MKARLMAVAAAALLAPVAAFPVEVDGIVARAGDVTVLRSDVQAELRRLGAPADRFNEIRNAIIDRKLILKAAADSKMTMQEWVVDNRIHDIVERGFGGDRNKLMATLQAQKVSYPEWRAKMKEDMIVAAMRWQVVDRNVNASPAAMRREYDTHPERYVACNRVTVEVILLKPEDAGLRDEVTAALKSRDFGDLARKYSADSHAADGGLWKDVDPEATFKPEICAEINSMPNGTISHWIEIDGWSFLIRKVSSEAGGVRSFADAYDDVEGRVREDEAKRLYEAWIDRLRSNAYIKVY